MLNSKIIQVTDNRHARAASAISSDDIEVVSFDIFDTLISRDVFDPKDIFNRVAAHPAAAHLPLRSRFSTLRAKAEKALRIRMNKQGIRKDPSLDDIYLELSDLSGIAVADLSSYRDLEIEQELASVNERPSLKKLYEYAFACGRQVVLCSDMYLPREVIEAMLEKCGYCGKHTLYLSCEAGFTKKHGNLFEHVSNVYHVDPEAIIHFGDNETSDVRRAEESGWKAMHVPAMKEIFFGAHDRLSGLFPTFRNAADVKSDATKQNYALIWQYLFDDTLNKDDADSRLRTPKDFGYVALGPFLLSLTLWIIRQSRVKGVTQIGFLARDGHLPIKAAKLLTEALELDLDLKYVPISRRAIFPFMLQQPDGLDRILSIRYDAKQTVGRFLRQRFGQVGVDIFETESESHPGFTSQSLMVDHHENVARLMRSNLDRLRTDSLHQSDNLVKAYQKIFADGRRVAIFDVGRKGTFQSVLTEITGANLHGLYVVTDYEIQKNAPKRSFDSFLGTMDARVQAKVPDTIMYEALLSEKGPSFIGFDDDGKPLRDEPGEVDAHKAFYTELHEGALDYVQEAISRHGLNIDDLEQEPFYAAYALEHWSENEAATELLRELPHEDSVSIPTAKSLGDYFLSPRRAPRSFEFPLKSDQKRVMIYAPAMTRIKGGAERIAARLANFLNSSGYEVLVFTSGKEWESEEPVYSLRPGIIVRSIDVRDVDRITELVAGFDPDCALVLASGPPVASIALAFVRNNVPVLLSERASPEHAIETYWKGFTAEDYFSVYEAASMASVQFGSFRDMFPEHMRSRVTVLPNPIERIAKRNVKREKLIICAARIWFEQKQQHILLEAFAKIADKYPDWKLAFYGASYGDDRKSLSALSKRHGLSGRVMISDPIGNIEEEMAKASLFVLPSAFEGFPNALAEALALGTPSIGFSTCPGTNELIEDGVNGRLVNDFDLERVAAADTKERRVGKSFMKEQRAERLAAALDELMGNAALRSRMSKSAFEMMHKYSEAEMSPIWGAAVETLLAIDGAIFKSQREAFLTQIVDRRGSASNARLNSKSGEMANGISTERGGSDSDSTYRADRETILTTIRARPLSLMSRLKLFLKTKSVSLRSVSDQDLFEASLAPVGNIVVPPPPTFDEATYLSMYPDVDDAVRNGHVQSGFVHYVLHGHFEGRSRPVR